MFSEGAGGGHVKVGAGVVVEEVGEQVARQMRERLAEFLFVPACRAGGVPGLIADVSDVARSFTQHHQQRGEPVIEAHLPAADRDRFLLREPGFPAPRGVRGLAVVTAIDRAHGQGDRRPGPGVEAALLATASLSPA